LIRNASVSKLVGMTTLTNPDVRRRRRGEALEAALLDAAWDELADAGFASLTMESVAARAQTGVAVLYRRWPNKDELVFAAIEHYRSVRPVEVPDSGSLRGDLIALLNGISKARAPFLAIAAAAAFSGLLTSTGLTLAEARDKVIGDQPMRDHVIYRRAHARGEIDLDRVPAAVLAMPFDLLRHDMLMDLKPLRPARVRSIVDELFLPLVERHRAAPDGT
jgi:AcrR family transcriptional regulator